jgi:hypothetical protein
VRLAGVARPSSVTVNGERAEFSYDPAARIVTVLTGKRPTDRPLRVSFLP